MSADRRLKLTITDHVGDRMHLEELTTNNVTSVKPAEKHVMSVQTSRGRSVHLDHADARELVNFLLEWLPVELVSDDAGS